MTQPPSGQWSDPYQPPPPPAYPPASPTYPAYQAPPTAQYGVPPGYGPAPYPVARPTNGMALASMIVALAGIISGIGFPIGAILGHIALKQVRETGEQGESYAKAGIIVGWIGTALVALGCIGYIVFFVALFRTIPNSEFQ
jgi:hypothetical protein